MAKAAQSSSRKARTAYIDATDFTHELGEGLGGIQLYCSPEDLLKHEKCAKECGIYKVSVHFEEVVRKPLPFDQYELTPYDDSVQAVCASLISSYETRIQSFQSEIERLREKVRKHNESGIESL